ncbi:MAG: hypothetical protein QG661_797 [Actinomycetota bacterium]|jgi:hypothetical protein|nr:hypothetical protein [Actinomycetota bacterium]
MTVERASMEDEDLLLLRAFEPVVRLTQGEFFMPVGVDEYVRHASLWRVGSQGDMERVTDVGELDLDELARRGRELDGPGYSLSGISVPHSRRDRVRSWFKTERPKFRAGNRLGEVGITGRAIDTLSRTSLLVRGAVPGGSAVASLALQNAYLEPDRPKYHGRVLRDNGWIVCQYWYFYSFNNWRSGFSGVNEHESDWEQVTIFLDGTGLVDDDGLPEPRWVVFSAHDETGDDLRRRWDDPDLSLVDGRHPVVFAGAGSHSGAYLAGDYLITVVPPRLGGIVPAIRRLAKVMTPWTRAAQGSGLGIPYIDYARGDGASIGPGQEYEWTPVVIDDDVPWVRDYRGLWGHDTQDKFGGERGPAGPRYERNATVRASWGDPVGWAGLAKVAPNPGAEMVYISGRLEDIDEELAVLDVDTARARIVLAEQAAGHAPRAPEVRALEAEERRITEARLTAIRLRDERARMVRAQEGGVAEVGPHAHLSHRRTPIAVSERGRARMLSAWAVVSTPIILLLLATIFLPGPLSGFRFVFWMLIAVLAVEAFARGYFLSYLSRLVFVLLFINFLLLFFINWRWAIGGLFVASAIIVLIVNIRDARRG